MKNISSFDFYKKRNFLVYFSSFIVILILITTVYFTYFKKADVAPVSQIPKYLLDTRFLVLYGQVSKVEGNLISIETIKDSTLTDYVFDDLNNIKVTVETNSIVKGFDVEEKVYRDSKISDIKSGDFVTVYINNATSSGYKAIGLKVFSKNIIE